MLVIEVGLVMVLVIGDEHVRLCCFLLCGEGVVLVDDASEAFGGGFVSLVERSIG